MTKSWSTPPGEALRVGPGFDLAAVDASSTPGWEHGRSSAESKLEADGNRLSEVQERLYAHGRTGGSRAVLLVLQGMDTAGKGGIVRHVLGMVDPQGVQLHSFGVPTEKERSQHYLQRIREALPAGGRIGVFDRSHYEDVLVVRVNELVPREVWEPRYDEINAFEREVVDSGTVIVKVVLHVSQEEQKARLRERLERPDKYWKFNPKDVDERAKWPALPGGVPGGPGPHEHRARALVRRPRRLQVVRAAGRRRPGARRPSRASTWTGRRPTSTSRRRRPGWTRSRSERSRTG